MKLKKIIAKTKTGWTDWVQPDPNKYLMGCCDCGLVHELRFRLYRQPNGRYSIQFRARRRREKAE